MKYVMRREMDPAVEKDIENAVDLLLYNRGIDDFIEYQELSEFDECDWHNLNDINNAVKMLLTHMENNSRISILVDTDPDGYTSAAALYNYLKTKVNDLHYIIHKQNKAHGLSTPDDVDIPQNTRLLIIPDAGTNDFEECSIINQYGCDVLILDHHEAESVITSNKHTVIVNNQISDTYSNKDLSGVGVVYKFLQAMDDALEIDEADDYLDLVALGNIADVMDVRSYETKYYIERGLENIRNKAFLAFIDYADYKTRGVINMHNIAWFIVSTINGCIRFGSAEERDLLFRAFIEQYEEFDYIKRGGEKVKEDIYTRAARLSGNAKSKQDRARKKGIDRCIERYGDEAEDKVIVIDVTGALEKNLTGVTAIRIAEYFQTPCILLYETEEKDDNGDPIYRGSGRNFDNSPIDSFKDICQETGMFEYAQGHANAFGVAIKESNIPKAVLKFNENLQDLEYDHKYFVDEIIDDYITTDDCIDYSNFDNFVGTGVDAPCVLIRNVEIYKKDTLLVGKSKNVIQFIIEGVKYVMFEDQEEYFIDWVKNTWDENECITLNLIGTPNINVYKDVREPQFIITDYELVKGNWIEFDEDDDDIWGD